MTGAPNERTIIRYVVMAIFLVMIVGPAATFMWTASRQYSPEDGPVPWAVIGVFSVFGLLFLTAVVLIFSRVRKISRVMAAAKAESAAAEPVRFSEDDPQAPWLLREDWKSGRAFCSNEGAMIGVWIFAVIFLGVTLFANGETLLRIVKTGEFIPALGLLFVLAGLLGIVFAIYCTARWKKYGASVFEIKNRTGRVGGALTGTIRCSRDVQPTGDYELELVCKEIVVTGSGKNRRTTAHRRWEKKMTLPGSAYSARSGIPVSIPIEAECLATDDSRARGTVKWQLEIKAQTAGVDYSAEFEVPVFHVKP